MLPVARYLQERDGERPVGVYGLLDSRHNLQYVGFSRNMVLSVKVRSHGGKQPQACKPPLKLRAEQFWRLLVRA